MSTVLLSELRNPYNLDRLNELIVESVAKKGISITKQNPTAIKNLVEKMYTEWTTDRSRTQAVVQTLDYYKKMIEKQVIREATVNIVTNYHARKRHLAGLFRNPNPNPLPEYSGKADELGELRER